MTKWQIKTSNHAHSRLCRLVTTTQKSFPKILIKIFGTEDVKYQKQRWLLTSTKYVSWPALNAFSSWRSSIRHHWHQRKSSRQLLLQRCGSRGARRGGSSRFVDPCWSYPATKRVSWQPWARDMNWPWWLCRRQLRLCLVGTLQDVYFRISQLKRIWWVQQQIQKALALISYSSCKSCETTVRFLLYIYEYKQT